MNSGLSRDEIIRRIARGQKRTEIALDFGVTPQAVNYHLNGKGQRFKDPAQLAVEHIPWDVRPEHKEGMPYRMLRSHLKWVVARGRGLSDGDKARLFNWYRELVDLNLVVEYDPEAPPTHGLSSGGWRYLQREESDNDLVIRVNDLSHMTDEAYEYFRLPIGAA